MDSRSMRSSGDNSSSGNGSDVELLSSKKSSSKNRSQQQQQQQQQIYIQSQQQQQQSNYYEIAQFNTSSKSDKSRSSAKQRGLDSLPKELRNSKQSFQQAMEKPCEFFVDVM